jgi:hypothetical protein
VCRSKQQGNLGLINTALLEIMNTVIVKDRDLIKLSFNKQVSSGTSILFWYDR